MADKNASQTQQTKTEGAPAAAAAATAATPFTMPTFTIPPAFAAAGEQWKKLVDDHVARLGSVMEEMATLENRNLEQARLAVDEFAKLTHASLSYAHELTENFRRMSIEAVKRSADLASQVQPKA